MVIKLPSNVQKEFRGTTRHFLAVQIPAGQATTDVIDLAGGTLVSIQTPEAINGTQFMFKAGHNVIDLDPCYDDAGALLAYPMGVNQHILLPEDDFDDKRFLIIITATQNSPVIQDEDCELWLTVKSTL